jgi:hypothetical protein
MSSAFVETSPLNVRARIVKEVATGEIEVFLLKSHIAMKVVCYGLFAISLSVKMLKSEL